MVANHTGCFDIVIFSAVDAAFVRRQERSGKLAVLRHAGAAAAKPSSSSAPGAARPGKSRDEIRERLLAGDALVLFPEGTSNDGNRVLPFKSALMGAAEAQFGTESGTRIVPVQPVSTAYVGLHGMPMGRENRPLFAWYGDMELVPHLWEALKAGPFDVVVEFHPPISLDAGGRRKDAGGRGRGTVRRRPGAQRWARASKPPPRLAGEAA